MFWFIMFSQINGKEIFETTIINQNKTELLTGLFELNGKPNKFTFSCTLLENDNLEKFQNITIFNYSQNETITFNK